MVVLTMGVIMPTVQKAGIDPLWFGIFIVLVVEMAQITPPVGFNLFVLQGMTRREIGTIARAAFPFFCLMVLMVVLLYVFPAARDLPAAADAALTGRGGAPAAAKDPICVHSRPQFGAFGRHRFDALSPDRPVACALGSGGATPAVEEFAPWPTCSLP